MPLCLTISPARKLSPPGGWLWRWEGRRLPGPFATRVLDRTRCPAAIAQGLAERNAGIIVPFTSVESVIQPTAKPAVPAESVARLQMGHDDGTSTHQFLSSGRVGTIERGSSLCVGYPTLEPCWRGSEPATRPRRLTRIDCFHRDGLRHQVCL